MQIQKEREEKRAIEERERGEREAKSGEIDD
jgi:hypothetical protein